MTFGLYVHVPFCAHRCGYCDFNTYADLDDLQQGYVEAALREIAMARREVGERGVDTVFFGGGTPTRLPAAQLVALLRAVDDQLGLAPGAEVTTEANPESVDAEYLAALREGGFTRLSFGMQSAAPHVLATLERRHSAGRPERCVAWAKAAGFEHVSLDLIYGTPGETRDDWQASLDAAVGAAPDHVSAYALVVEPGTRMHAQVARGELAATDPDTQADRYEQADEALTAAGYGWYEVSNWARPGGACRHNLGYWRGADWWGVGPGAHSHVAGVRWWNVKHPRTYAERLAASASPEEAREVLTDEQRAAERVLLGIRLAEGLPATGLDPREVDRIVAGGLAVRSGERLVLTRRGRLLADAVVRDLVA